MLKNEYWTLVETIISENRVKTPGKLYFKHHILPRSIYPIFKNEKWNLILVTWSEHKALHELLSKLTVGKCQETMIRDLNYFK